MAARLDELKAEVERDGKFARADFHGCAIVTRSRPAAFKRCLANLVSNAARSLSSIGRPHRPSRPSLAHDRRSTTTARAFRQPGHARGGVQAVPAPRRRARNQDEVGTGLGLAIARDIARSRTAATSRFVGSPLGGLRATVRACRCRDALRNYLRPHVCRFNDRCPARDFALDQRTQHLRAASRCRPPPR